MNVAPLFRGSGEFFIIAGPCTLEDHALHLEIAAELWKIRREFSMPVIFKGSFDKANRTNGGSSRGPGLEQGLKMLARLKAETSLPVMTDIHEPGQAQLAAQVCDALQIPAFLCRQTDLLHAAALTGRPVNLKKGQWMGAAEMKGAVEKIRAVSSAASVAVTERGTFFGYGDLVVDFRNIPKMKWTLGTPVIYDGTHAVQQPGQGQGGASGGLRHYIVPLVRAAVAAGADGLFLEVHPRPETAPSDSDSMLPLDSLRALVRDAVLIRRALL